MKVRAQCQPIGPADTRFWVDLFGSYQMPGRPSGRCFFVVALTEHMVMFFVAFIPGSIAKGSSSKSGCQLHLPTSHANLSRVTSPANFSCQLVESYFTCQLLMPTCRELLHLPTSHVNFLRVTSPANFSCQLFGCYLILLKAQANLSGVTSLS